VVTWEHYLRGTKGEHHTRLNSPDYAITTESWYESVRYTDTAGRRHDVWLSGATSQVQKVHLN
jgi:hypothetical protein